MGTFRELSYVTILRARPGLLSHLGEHRVKGAANDALEEAADLTTDLAGDERLDGVLEEVQDVRGDTPGEVDLGDADGRGDAVKRDNGLVLQRRRWRHHGRRPTTRGERAVAGAGCRGGKRG